MVAIGVGSAEGRDGGAHKAIRERRRPAEARETDGERDGERGVSHKVWKGSG